MIRVQTDTGPVDVDATAKDVSISGGHLKVTKDGVVIAQFRAWEHWHQTDQEEVRP